MYFQMNGLDFVEGSIESEPSEKYAAIPLPSMFFTVSVFKIVVNDLY